MGVLYVEGGVDYLSCALRSRCFVLFLQSDLNICKTLFERYEF